MSIARAADGVVELRAEDWLNASEPEVMGVAGLALGRGDERAAVDALAAADGDGAATDAAAVADEVAAVDAVVVLAAVAAVVLIGVSPWTGPASTAWHSSCMAEMTLAMA